MPKTVNDSGTDTLFCAEAVPPIYGTGERVYDRPGYVYFFAGERLIKIGFSGAPNIRLKAVRTKAGEPLKMLARAVGWMSQEAALHRKFAHLREIRNGEREWFRFSPEIDRVIAEIQKGVSLDAILAEAVKEPKPIHIPTVASEFENWATRECGRWPGQLQVQAFRALQEMKEQQQAIAGSAELFATQFRHWMGAGSVIHQ